MSSEATDTTTMTGAEFQRHAGTDAHKWAEALDQALRQQHELQPYLSATERTTLLAQWFRDYAEVCVAEEVGRVTARLVPRHDD
jgi:hypothetical protein